MSANVFFLLLSNYIGWNTIFQVPSQFNVLRFSPSLLCHALDYFPLDYIPAPSTE